MKLNPKQKKIAGGIIIGLVLLAIIYFFFKKDKPQTPPAVITPQKDGGVNVAEIVIEGNDNFPLKIGSKGEKVKQLQQALNTINEKQYSNKFKPLVTDGVYGTATQNAIGSVVGYMYLNGTGLNEGSFSSIILKSKK